MLSRSHQFKLQPYLEHWCSVSDLQQARDLYIKQQGMDGFEMIQVSKETYAECSSLDEPMNW